MRSSNRSIEDIGAKLQELVDRAEIADVIHRYGRGVASSNAEIVGSCFTEDAIVELEYTVLEGGPAIRHFYGGRLGAKNDVPAAPFVLSNKISTPVMANIEIELKGDAAHCESTCLAIHAGNRDEKGLVVVRGTRNIDEFVYTESGWRIRRRKHTSSWVSESPGKLTH